MSTKVKNAETKLVTDSQVTAAAQVADAVKPSASTKVSAQAPQAAAALAVKKPSEAEVAKKKALEEEALAEDQIAAEESQTAADAQAATQPLVEALESQVELVTVDQESAEEIARVAEELDGGVTGLEAAARDIGMMFAQAGSSATTASTIGGVSTGAVVAGVVVVGAVAASGGSSSSGVASTGSSGGGSATSGSYDMLSVGLAPTTFLASPSGTLAAVTATAVSGTSSYNSALYTNQFLTKSTAASAWTSTVSSGLVGSLSTTGTSSNDLFETSASALGTLRAASALVTATNGVEIYIDGGAGTDLLGLTLDASVPGGLNLTGVEIVSVTASGGARTLDTDDFSGVNEIWNSGSSQTLTLTNVDSTATYIGLEETSSVTTVTYGASLAATNSTINLVLDETNTGTVIVINTAGVQVGGISTVRISSNGDDANVLSSLSQSASGTRGVPELVTTLQFYGDNDLTVSDITGMTGVTRVDASGMKGDFTLNMGALSAAAYSVEGGVGADEVIASVSGATALNTNRVETANLELGGTTNTTVSLANTVGLTTVELSNSLGGSATLGFTNIESGTAFTTSGTTTVAGATTFTFKTLGDFTFSAAHDATFTGGVTLNKVRVGTLTSAVAGADGSFGVVTLGADVQELNVTTSNTGTMSLTSVTGGASSDLIVKYVTSNTGTITQSDVTRSTKDLYVRTSATRGTVDVDDLQSLTGKVVLDMDAVSANASVGDIVAQTDISVTIDSGVSYAGNPSNAPTQFTSVIQGTMQANTGDISVTINAAAPEASGVVSIIGGMAADGRVSLVANNGQYGDIFVNGTIQAVEDIHVNVRGLEYTQLSIGNMSALDDVGIAVSAGVGSTGTIGNVVSSRGDVAVAFNIDSLANDATSADPEVSTYSIGTINTSAGSVTLGTISVGTSAAGNTGAVQTALGEEATLSVGNITAVAGDIDIGGVNGLELGVRSDLRLGSLTANSAGKTISVGSADHVLAVALEGTVTMGNISAGGDVLINADLDRGATLGGGATVDAVGGTTTIAVVGGESNAFMNFGNVSAAGALTIDFVGGNNSTAALGALTSDNAGIDLDLTADTLTNTGTISARSNIDISIKTISDGSGSVGTSGITSLSGNITVKGDTALATSNAISTVTIGALTATSANGTVAIGAADDAISLGALTDLSLGNINANRQVGIYAELAANATLGGQNTIDSVASTTTISALGGAAGAYLDFSSVSASGALTVDFVGGNNSTVRIANLTSDNGGISLDLTADTFTNTGATNTANGDIDISIITISNGSGAFGSFTSTAGNIEIQGDTSLADSTVASTVTVGAINVNAAGKTFMVGSASDSISIGDNAELELGAVSARGNVGLYASLSQAATLGSGNTIDSISGTTTINATSAEPSSVLHFGNVSAAGALAIDFVGGNSSDVLLGNILSDTGSVRMDIIAGDTITMGSVIATASTASVDLDLTTLNGTPTVLVNDSISAGRDVDLKLTLAANDTATDIATAGGITATFGDIRVSGLSSIATGNQVDIGFLSATANGGSVSFGSAATAGEIAINGIMNVDSIDAFDSVDIYVELGGGATTALAGQFNQVNNGEIVVSNGTATFDVVAGNNAQFALGNVTAQGAITSDFVGTTGSAQSFAGNVHATNGNINIDFVGGEFDVVNNISAEGLGRTITLDLTLTDSVNSSEVSSDTNDKIHAGGDLTVTVKTSASVTAAIGDQAANAGLISNTGSVRITGDSYVGASGVLNIGRIYADGQLGTVSIGDSTPNGSIELNASSTMSVGDISSEGDVGVYVTMAESATLDITNITVDGGVDSGDVYISALGSTAFTNLRLDTIRGEDRVDVIFRGDEMSTVDIGDVETVENNVTIDLVVGNQTTAGAGGAAAVTIDNIDAANRNDGISTAFGDATITVVAGTRANILIGDRGTSNSTPAEINASGNVNLTLTTGEGTVNTVRDVTSVSGNVNLINTVRSSSDQLVASNTTLTYGDITANDHDINIDAIVGGDGGLYFADLLAGDDITFGGLDQGQNTLAATIGFDADVTTATIRAVDDINIRANLDSGASWSSGTIQSVDGDVYINFQTSDNGQLTTASGTGAITLGAINADRGAATVIVRTSESVIDSPTITMPSITANTISLNYRGTDDATLGVPSATGGTGDLTTVLTSTARINTGKVIDVDLAGTADIRLTLSTAVTNGNNTETDANLLRGTLSILGSESTDTIIGGEGVDTIMGNGGNDFILVWDLQDISGLAESINGGDGVDTLRFRVASSVFALDPTGTNTINTIDFTTVTNTNVERIELAHDSVLRIQVSNMSGLTQIDGDYNATGGSDIELNAAGTYDFGQSVFTVFEDIHTIYANSSASAGVNVNGSYNHDHIIGNIGADSLVGGSGNDTLVGGIGNDTIVGGSGNDSISGGIGEDSIAADEGNNYVDGGLGNNTVSAGSGNDTIVTSSGNDTIAAGDGANSVNAGAGTNSITAGTGADTIIGGNDGDTVVASDGDNSVNVGNGTNSVTAGTGSDTIIGGTGGDTVAASEGNNYVSVGDGTNSVTAGSGNDTVIGGANADVIAAGNGNNSILAGDGANSITAGSGNDLVITTAGADTIVLSGGDDTVSAGEGLNSITTGTGADSITSGAAADTISAGDGANTIRAGDGANHVTAGTGSDYIVVTEGADTVVASHGNNTVLAGEGANSITAGTGADSIQTGAGNDTIAASDGDNRIEAGAGANTITAGTGSDTIVTLGGDDTISASHGANSILAGEGANSVTAGTGSDFVTTGGGQDTIVVSEGNNTVSSGSANDSVTSGSGDDSIVLGDGDDTVVAGNGSNNINGGNGADSITAGTGADVIDAGAGNDTIIGGGGADEITAGAGNDRISFAAVADFATSSEVAGGGDTDTIAFGAAGTITYVGRTVSSVEILEFTAGATNLVTVTQGTGLTTVNNLTTANNTFTLNAGTTVFEASAETASADVNVAGEWHWSGSVLTYYDQTSAGVNAITFAGTLGSGSADNITVTSGNLVLLIA